jgi:hypothetical protein
MASSGRPLVSGAITRTNINETIARPRNSPNVPVPPMSLSTVRKKREIRRLATRSAVSIVEAPAVRSRAGKLSEA